MPKEFTYQQRTERYGSYCGRCLSNPCECAKKFDMSKWFEKELAATSLKDRVRITLEMNDIKNWDNGEYNGDQTELTNHIIEDVKKWIKDGSEIE